MNTVLLVRIGIMALVCGLPAVTLAQDQGLPEPESGPMEEIVVPDPGAPGPVQLVRPESSSYTVRLHVDRNLVGRVRVARKKGKPTPVMAELVFFDLQAQPTDAPVDISHTTASGYFQMTQLVPGKYMASVVSVFGPVNFEVEVLPFDENATPEEMLLDVILLPNVDLDLLEEMVVEQCCPNCGAAGGGSCEQGHRWGLLGLAGLAGLAGIGDGEKPVSPFKPDEHH